MSTLPNDAAPPPEKTPQEIAMSLGDLPLAERERVWFDKVYQGGVPQFTARAVVMGGLLGGVMAISNLYTTLKVGWSFGVTITACVISYVIWNAFVGVGVAKTRMTLLENNCMQSTASAAGSSTGGTLATAVGAMLLINGDAHRMGWVPVAIWVGLVACLGVFLAIPMKRQMINVDQLPFPSGIAAAETLRSLYAEGRESILKSRALLGGLVAGGLIAFLRDVIGTIPGALSLPFVKLTQVGKTAVTLPFLGVTFEPSMLLVAAGMIVGMRVSVSMLLGACINYFVLAPVLVHLPDWVVEHKHFLGHIEAGVDEAGVINAVKVTRWSLWLGTSLMVSSGLTQFAMGWRTIVRAFASMTQGRPAEPDDIESKMAAIEVPTSWMAIGLLPITLGLVGLCWFAMGINPLLGVFSVVMSFALALVACRATGETDTTPIGAMGKITQLVYAVLSPANPTVNLMTAGITAGAAGSSADLLTDLKSGYLLGANPKQQFMAQLSGVFFGVLAIVPAWYLMVPDAAALEKYNPPATHMWQAVAEALSHGVSSIPQTALVAIVIGAIIGVALPVLEAVFPKAKPYMPSAMGLGLAFVVTFANSLSFFLGALIAYAWTNLDKQTAERYIVPIASGAIAGESLVAAGTAIYGTASGLLGIERTFVTPAIGVAITLVAIAGVLASGVGLTVVSHNAMGDSVAYRARMKADGVPAELFDARLAGMIVIGMGISFILLWITHFTSLAQ
jgi:OPT family oligopeptide transporter